mgnify:CR=1 FL=1
MFKDVNRQDMKIEVETQDKARYMGLLLLADEQESMIARYLTRGDLFVMRADGRFGTMMVGTGDSVTTVSFYRSCGFEYSHSVAGFFTDNYDHIIVEDGKVLTDMLYFRKSLC